MDDLLMEYEGNKPTTPTERERRRRLAATVTICGLAFVGIGQLTTGAWFTDQGTANVDFATGTVAIELAGPTGTPGKTITLPNVADMAPGDTEYLPVHVTNTGSLGLYYAVTGQSSIVKGGDLSQVMQYSVVDVANQAACDKDAFGGTPLFGPDTIGTTETALVGNKAETGNEGVDRKLASTAGEWLCVRAALPGGTTVGNAYQDSKTTVTLTFYAVQSKNTA